MTVTDLREFLDGLPPHYGDLPITFERETDDDWSIALGPITTLALVDVGAARVAMTGDAALQVVLQ